MNEIIELSAIGKGTFYLGDCFEVMKDIPNNSVDLSFTSPPYNMNLRIRNGKHVSRQIVKEISTKYEHYSDNLPMKDYFEFNKKVINELLRISKMVFYNVQFLTGNKSALFNIIGCFSENIKEIIIWDKINAEPAIGQQILNSRFEAIIVFCSKEDAISRKFKDGQFDRGSLQNLWPIKRGKKPLKNHGAVFPEELAEKIITNFTKENDLIFDPFGGSGTTAVVCERLKRRWILSEISEEYYNLAIQRIKTDKDHACRGGE